MKNSLIISAILAFTVHAAAAQDAWLPDIFGYKYPLRRS